MSEIAAIECSPVDRTYCFSSCDEMIRSLRVDRYDEEGNETASYVYRLHNHDPRPRGRFCENAKWFNDFLGTLPLGVWIKLVWQADELIASWQVRKSREMQQHSPAR